MKFDNFNIFSFAKRIYRPLILDGATGTLLQNYGVNSKEKYWSASAIVDAPDVIHKIHSSYIKAGADIITANTFRTNPAALSGSKLSSKKLVSKAVKIAKEIAFDKNILVAGSNPPAEDCYQIKRNISSKLLKENHHNHIDYLYDNDVSFILNETQSHFDEIKIICTYCYKNNIPFVVSLFVTENLTILSGEKVSEVIKYISDYAPAAIGFNCIKPAIFYKVYNKISSDINWGFYLNCGSGDYSDNKIKCGIYPAVYASLITDFLDKKPSFVGACCGSTYSHIKELKKLFDEPGYNKITG
jgi:homocysteine S-methyltransferase